MTGIVVATHGSLGRELLKTASLFCSVTQEAVGCVVFSLEDSTDTLYAGLKDAIGRADQGDGIFVLTDLLGGSPANQASRFLAGRSDVEIITGVNLPMLLTLLMERGSKPMGALKESVLTASRAGIVSIREKMEPFPSQPDGKFDDGMEDMRESL